jgi:hypothetical protein
MRAKGMFRLALDLTLQQMVDELDVHLNSFEYWRKRWHKFDWSVSLQAGTLAVRANYPVRSNVNLLRWFATPGHGRLNPAFFGTRRPYAASHEHHQSLFGGHAISV